MTLPRVIDESDISPSLDAVIRRNLCVANPNDVAAFSKERAWHGSCPSFSVIIEENGEVLAHVGVVDRTISVGNTPLRIAGIQNVFVLPEKRGTGLSGKVMKAAMREAEARRFEMGLLFCIPALEKVYAPLGWLSLGPRETLRIENGKELPLPDKNIAMYYPLAMNQFPEGVIHLKGNDW